MQHPYINRDSRGIQKTKLSYPVGYHPDHAIKVIPSPKGRNVVIAKSWGYPQIAQDGFPVAKEIELVDKNQFQVPPALTSTERIAAFIDLGTNSVRLLVVRINPNHSYSIISQQKEAIRLGERFSDHRLHPEAMQRAVSVCRQFAEMARSLSATEVIAVATSATREAENQNEFLDRFQQETGVDLHVISGREEARLIYLGVASGLHLGKQRTLFIDIGGGSTELVVGDQQEYAYLDSLKLGAMRLTAKFIHDPAAPVSAATYAKIQAHVRSKAIRSLQHLRDYPFDLVVGSSGTIEALAVVAARALRKDEANRELELTRRDIDQLSCLLCPLSAQERKNLPGMNPARADIIIAGMAIIHTLMQEIGITCIKVSERGLRDGLLVDYLNRVIYSPEVAEMSVRARSVMQLGRGCNYDEPHARRVAQLSLALFDSARTCKLHKFGKRERELLAWAAQLHDIGVFLSFTNHPTHGAYFIRNADLLGFNQWETDVIAGIVYAHSKTLTHKKIEAIGGLDAAGQQLVRQLSPFLRLAESLDRSHSGLVHDARFTPMNAKSFYLVITAPHGCQLELTSVQTHLPGVKKAFGCAVELRENREKGDKSYN